MAVAVLVLAPAAAWAQSAIAGTVRDNSGAVLPGVTVEAASPVLIEQTRTVITDEQGRYNMIDLRPGAYKVTYTLPGFTTFVRDGVEVPGNVTVTIDAELRVGALEETITVSGATPVVDVQNVQRTQVLTRDVVDALPITRNSHSIAAVVPGVKLSRPDVGGSQMMEQVAQSTHGSLVKDITMQVDGMLVNSSMSDYGIQAYNDDALNQEVSVQTSALGADVMGGGVRINMIPKDGGNVVSGALYLAGTPESWQSNNLDDELRAKGIRAPNGIQHIQDFNGSVGGPIVKNKLWFFGSARHISVNEKVTNAFYPDGSPAIVDQYVRDGLVRLTYQMSQKNKIASYFERIWKFKGHELTTGTDVVKASGLRDPKNSLYYVGQAKFTSTVTSRLLVEVGYSTNHERLRIGYQPGIAQAPFTPAWYAGAAKRDLVLNTLNNAAANEVNILPDMHLASTSASYVTGSHNMKVGLQWAFGPTGRQYTANADLVQQYRAGVPDSVAVYNTPSDYFHNIDRNMGIYAQDSWSTGKLTVNAGLRIDHLKVTSQDISLPAGRFVPARSFSQSDYRDSAGNSMDGVPNFWDFSPRVSAAYDLFGNQRTALKASYSKYVITWSDGWGIRYNPLTFASETRNWRDLNGDDIAQDGEIGPSQNARFGFAQTRFPDPNLEREYNIEYSGAIQHQVFQGFSVLGAWYRRSFKNVESSINELVSLSDYIPFQTANPLDGTPLTVYNLNPAKQGQVRRVDRNSDINGRTYDGWELSFNARLPRGANVFGGWTTDRIVRFACDTNDANLLRFCDERDFDIPFRHDFKLSGNLPLPWDFQFSGVFMSYAGTNNLTNPDGVSSPQYLRVNWVVPAGVFPNGQRTEAVTVNLIEPGTKYGERWTQLDLQFKRLFRFGAKQLTGEFNIYNALNNNTVLTQNQTFGAALDQPLTLLQGRIYRATLQFKF